MGVSQAEGEKRSKAVRTMDGLQPELIEKVASKVVKLTGIKIDAPGFFGPDVVGLKPGDGLIAVNRDMRFYAVYPIAEIALIELQVFQEPH